MNDAPLFAPDPAAKPDTPLLAGHIDRFIDVPQVPRWAGRIVYVLVALIVAIGLWASLAKYDVVVRGEGRLAAPTQQISVQVYETSVVKSIDVRIGQHVGAGTRVATLDSTFTGADRYDFEHQVEALTAAKQRIEAEIDGRSYDPVNPNPSEAAQVRIYRERQAERESHISSLEKKVSSLRPQLEFVKNNLPLLTEQRELARQIVEMNQELTSKGLGHKNQLLEAKLKEVDSLSKLIESQRDQIKFTEEIVQAESDRDSYLNEWNRKLAEEYQTTSKDLDTAVAKLTKADRRGQLVAMTAPVNASVLDIPKRNIGSVLREGETLMTLVPTNEPMPVDVAIESKDVAYLKIGQPATIKFESLPYQEYGVAHGRLTALSPDTTGDNALSDDASGQSGQSNNAGRQNGKHYYRALIAIERLDFRKVPDGFELRPGMRVTADVKVGTRTVAAYLLHPLMRAFDESLRER
jgi:HlyD family secretion protein